MVERARFHKNGFTHLPCDTYACENMAQLNIGGSDAAIFTWSNICVACAVTLMKSAFEVPELLEVILEQIKSAPEMQEMFDVLAGEQTEELKQLKAQIERLAAHILQEFPDEIGKGDPVNGEGAVDVAIRLLGDLKEAEAALEEIAAGDVPGEDVAAETEPATAIEAGEDPSEIKEVFEGGESQLTQPADTLVCPVCKFPAKTGSGLSAHIRIKHPEYKPEATSEPFEE